jgi:hypothetical protein
MTIKTCSPIGVKYKPIALLVAALLLLSINYAQTVSPQSVNSVGVKMTQSNGSVSFTLGELRVLSTTDSDGNSLGEGFANSATSSTTVTAIKTPSIDELNVSIYPNPSSELVFIEILDTKLEWVYVKIIDQTGRLILSEQYQGIRNKIGINTQDLPQGIYILNLSDNNQTLGTYNLLKK